MFLAQASTAPVDGDALRSFRRFNTAPVEFAIAVNTTSRFNTAPSYHERAECSCRSMTLFCTSAHYLSIDGVLFADVQSGLFNINVDKLYLITYYGAIRTPPRGAVWCVRNRFCGHCPSRWMMIDGCSTPVDTLIRARCSAQLFVRRQALPQ